MDSPEQLWYHRLIFLVGVRGGSALAGIAAIIMIAALISTLFYGVSFIAFKMHGISPSQIRGLENRVVEMEQKVGMLEQKVR